MDLVKPLKIESPGGGGAQTDFGPTEVKPTEDVITAKGVAISGNSALLITSSGNDMTFQDSTITTPATLKELLQGKSDSTATFQHEVLFSKSGNLTVGSKIDAGNVVNLNVGIPLNGLLRIVKIVVTTSGQLNTTSRLQVQRRLTRTTREDIADAYVEIAAGAYKGSRTMAVDLNADEEIMVYLKTGVTLADVNLVVYMVPR